METDKCFRLNKNTGRDSQKQTHNPKASKDITVLLK